MSGKVSFAYKLELRNEIEELRHIGGQMANLCFNLGQNATETDLGKMVTGHNLVTMYALSKQWDAIKRREKKL